MYILSLFAAGALQASATLAADDLIDPTRPAGWNAPVSAADDSATQPESLVLHGIFSVAGRHSAVISGSRVVVGDEVLGAEVIAIEKGRVILRRDGETVELVTGIPTVKTRPVGDPGVGRHATGDVARLLE